MRNTILNNVNYCGLAKLKNKFVERLFNIAWNCFFKEAEDFGLIDQYPLVDKILICKRTALLSGWNHDSYLERETTDH